MKVSFLSGIRLSLLACSVLGGVPALAQTAPVADGAGASGSLQSTDTTPAAAPDAADIIVTGTRRSLEDALRIKRNSVEVLDSISADGIGKLPDQNLAESLQRLPGVQINRSAQRRLGTISIRGLPGDFSQTLINGQYLASPDVSNFSFGTVRSEVFSGIDVIKANNASSITGGLSGLVNLRTGSPLSAPNQLAVSIDGKYEDLTQRVAPGGAVVFSRQIVPGVFGIRAAFGYQGLNFREDNAQINTYDRIAGAGTATDLSDDVYAPRQVRLSTQKTTGDSYSGAITAEWKPTESLKASIAAFYNEYRPDAYLSQFTIESSPTRAVGGVQTTTSVRTPIGTALNEGSFGQTQDHVLINNPLLIADSRSLIDRYRTYAITGNLEWTKDRWTIGGVVHYTKAKRTSDGFGYQAQQQAAVSPATNGLLVEINTGSGNLGNFVYDLRTGSPRLNLEQPFTAPTASPYRQINATANALQNFIGGFRNQIENEDELALEFNIERELDFGPIKSIRVGGSYRDKNQDQRNALQTLFGANLSGLNNTLYNYSFLDGSGSFLSGKIGFFDRGDYAELDLNRITALITPVNATNLPANTSVGPGGLVEFVDSTAISQIYDNKQTIYGGYALAKIDQQLGSDFHLLGNVGVRYEKSTRDTVSRDAANSPVPVNFSFDNWLPSLNLVLEGPYNLVLRGAYNKTLRRPQVDSFAVLRSIAVDGTGNLITVNLGAGDLKPFTSDNFDVSLEWYNRAGSSISVLLFQKNVHDYAGTTRVCPADGGGFGFGPLTNSSGVCRTVNATAAGGGFRDVFSGATANINVTANQSDFTLRGFEASAQQNLSFLPAPWNGFGGQVNYTYIDFSSSSSFRLSEISQDTVNAIVYYETKGFGVRAAYNFRSGYFLGSGGTASGADRFVKSRPQLDLSGQVNFTDRLTAKFEMFNVTNEVLYEYEGAVTRARNYTVYGRTFSAGLSYRF